MSTWSIEIYLLFFFFRMEFIFRRASFPRRRPYIRMMNITTCLTTLVLVASGRSEDMVIVTLSVLTRATHIFRRSKNPKAQKFSPVRHWLMTFSMRTTKSKNSRLGSHRLSNCSVRKVLPKGRSLLCSSSAASTEPPYAAFSARMVRAAPTSLLCFPSDRRLSSFLAAWRT